MGSGVRNIYKYNKIYSGADPVFIKEDVFKTVIPLVSQTSEHASEHASEHVNIEKDNTKEILKFCETPKSRDEKQEFIGIKSRNYFSRKALNPLANQ